MKTSSCGLLAVKAMLLLVVVTLLSPIGVAQINVEIELAGPWSYMQDPNDANRVMVIAPDSGHTMTVFPGENAFNYFGANNTDLAVGQHKLDFATGGTTCDSNTSSFFLYPVNVVGGPDFTNVPSYAISLPKPCYYESMVTSRFEYNGLRKLSASDQESSFTTWMTLHYKVASTTTRAKLENGALIAFGSNSGTNKQAISIILYHDLNTPADQECDSHSRYAFYLTENLWKATHVYRVFPKLSDSGFDNRQQPQPGAYDYDNCEQIHNPAPANMTDHPKSTKPSDRSKGKRPADPMHATSPGRADCHAPQFNINGFVQ
jgi:hypothetical protein